MTGPVTLADLIEADKLLCWRNNAREPKQIVGSVAASRCAFTRKRSARRFAQ